MDIENFDSARKQNNAASGWRCHLKVHPAANLFPLMSENDLRELGEDIKAHGLQTPIVLYCDQLLDGRNRLDAMELVGMDFEFIRAHRGPYKGRIVSLSGHGDLIGPIRLAELDWTDPNDVDPYEYAISLNIHRRHLTGEQKRELIAKVLKAKPDASNVTVAKQVKVSDKTVATVRHELEGRSEIPNVEKRTDSKGRKQPATKPDRPKPTDRATPPGRSEIPNVASTKKRRTTAQDVIEVWMELPTAEDRRVFEAIGLRRILAGIPEGWQVELEKWVDSRRSGAR